MSEARELLKECILILDTPFILSNGINLRNRITELLAQPEQCDKKTYIGETQWMQVPEPLSDADLGNLYYTAVKDNENGAILGFARAIEKAHGITGADNE